MSEYRLHRLALSAGLFGSLAVLTACGSPERITTTEHTTTTTRDAAPGMSMPDPSANSTTTTRTTRY